VFLSNIFELREWRFEPLGRGQLVEPNYGPCHGDTSVHLIRTEILKNSQNWIPIFQLCQVIQRFKLPIKRLTPTPRPLHRSKNVCKGRCARSSPAVSLNMPCFNRNKLPHWRRRNVRSTCMNSLASASVAGTES
jgi:hypothetical protein